MSSRDELIVGGRGLDDLLQTLAPKIQKNVQRTALRAGAKVYLREVQQRIPVASGQLRASARVTSRAKGATVSASVKVGNFVAWYAHMVEFGTRPHVIRAKPGHALRFGGVTAREVHHPGTRARPFMRPAADAGFSEAVQAYATKLRQRMTRQGINTPDSTTP